MLELKLGNDLVWSQNVQAWGPGEALIELGPWAELGPQVYHLTMATYVPDAIAPNNILRTSPGGVAPITVKVIETVQDP